MQRNPVRQAAAPERRSPAAVLAARVPTRAPSAAAQLQRRLGNQGAAGVARAVQRQSLTVSSPSDPAEREATAVAATVMRMPASAPSTAARQTVSGLMRVQRCACGSADSRSCACRTPVFRAHIEAKSTATPSAASEVQSSLSGGSPLPSQVRQFMEPRFGADFSNVRVHTGDQAARLSDGLSARAFTVGQHVFFGRNEFQPDTPGGKELIAHELTHTVQQGGVASGSAATMPVQRQEKSWWEEFTDFSEDFVWGAIRRISPSLEPIIRGGPAGVFNYLKARTTSAIESLFSTVMAPVRAIAGVGDRVVAFYGPIVSAMQAAAQKIAQNDCSPIKEAAEKIEQLALKILTPIVETVQPVVAKVKDFLNTVWETIGAPAWEWIKQYAKNEWQKLMDLIDLVTDVAVWIWDKTATIRAVAEEAWTWLKNKIGIGEGEEGRNGILQWAQRKVEDAWDWLKAKLEPFRREITAIVKTIAVVAVAVSPAGPVLAVGAAVAGAIQGIRWIAANWGKGNIVVQARTYLEKTLFPPLIGAAQRLGAAITGMAANISVALAGLAGGLVRAVGAVAGSLLDFAVGAVQWIADQAVKLAAWAARELGQLAVWLATAMASLKAFLQKIVDFLGRVGKVILNIWGLHALVLEKIWDAVPACVRDPIVDFLGPIILRQIEIFQELAKDDDAWQKTKADVGKIIRLVFKDGDLMGAVKATFHLILRVFNLPPDLLVTVARKAMAAWDVVVKKPLDFIKNTVRALGHGFRLMWANKWEHLKFGLQGWLFGELAEKKINPPASWSDPKALFFFVLEVLGLTVDHVWELLKKRFDPTKVEKFKGIVGKVAGVLEWVNKSIDTTKTPAQNALGIWDQAKTFGMSILTGIAEWVAAKVAEEVAILVAAAAASGGLSEVIDIIRRIYKAILTAVRWARRIVDMVNQALDNVLDIAAGAVEKVGVVFEKIMHRGMPVVIGFLADQVGLGGIGQAVRNVVDKLREQVDKALLWFIDKIKAGIEAVIALVQAGIAKVVDWWKTRKSFTAKDGKPHELFFQGGESGATLMMASKKPRSFAQVLADDKVKITNRDVIQKKLDDLNGEIAAKAGKKLSEEEKDVFQAVVAQRVVELSDLLELHLESDGELPATAVTYTVGAGGRPMSVRAEPLTKFPGNTTGQKSTGVRSHVAGFDVVSKWEQKTGEHQRKYARTPTLRSRITATHVLAEQLHGPFSAWNLVLTDQSLNNLMTRDPEAAALANFGNEKLSYSVTIQYFNNTKPEPAEYDVDEAEVDEVKKWVGFYLGWKFQVSVYKWDGTAYREKLWDAPVEGDMPPVQGERIPPLTERVLETLRAAADTANPITIDGVQYYPTLSQQALREELGVKQTRLQDARKTLEASGQIVVDPRRLYIRKGA